LYGRIIVDQGSATNLCNEHIDPIDANHLTIVKPTDEESQSYRALKEAFEDTEPPLHKVSAPAKPKIQIGLMLGADKGIGLDAIIDCKKPPYKCMSEEQAKNATPIPLDVGAKGWARIVFTVKNVGQWQIAKFINSCRKSKSAFSGMGSVAKPESHATQCSGNWNEPRRYPAIFDL
jgi:hypothetical protein